MIWPFRRRWFQFSLASLFIPTTLVATWLAWELSFIRERQAMRRWIAANGGFATSVSEWKNMPVAAGIPPKLDS